jgi:hypothetical protein
MDARSTPPGWRRQAEELVTEMDSASAEFPARESRTWADILGAPDNEISITRRWQLIRKCDDLVWQLWLTMGTVPMLSPSGNLRDEFSGYCDYYRTKLSELGELSDSEVHLRGLHRAIEMCDTSLWYPALVYVRRRSGLATTRGLHIHSMCWSGSKVLGWAEMPSLRSTRLGDTLRRWLTMNEDNLVWCEQKKRFRPKEGQYLLVAQTLSDLDRIIVEDFFSEAEVVETATEEKSGMLPSTRLSTSH